MNLQDSVARDNARKAAMKRFFALAKSEGLDTKDGYNMRQSLTVHLGRFVYSRAELSAGQWCECAAALECGLLAW